MSKVSSFLTVASGYLSTQQINANFVTVHDAFQNTLSLDGSSPNTMQADLDMNGHALMNAVLESFTIPATSITGVLTIAQGALGRVLIDPSADSILFWDDSASQYDYLTLGTGLSITGQTLNASFTGANTFSTIHIAGQSDVVADSTSDTLTLIAGANVTLTTNATNDSITITSATVGGATLADGDYGDIVVSSTGTVLSIDTAAVTLAQMANMATSSLIYRKTSGTGAPEVNSLATLKTDLGLTGTNSGDQTITLTGGVTGSGTGSFVATVVTNANLTGDVTSSGNATTIGAGKVTEAMLTTSDVTTANATTSKHGFLKKLDNTATHFMDGTGNWSSPTGIPTESKTVVAAATSSIITVDFTTYSAYRIYLSGLTSGTQYNFLVSQDGGSNYRTTTGAFVGTQSTTLTGGHYFANSVVDTSGQIPATTVTYPDGASISNTLATIDIIQPSTSSNTHFTFTTNSGVSGGGKMDSSSAINRFKFTDTSAGAFSGTITIIPLAKR